MAKTIHNPHWYKDVKGMKNRIDLGSKKMLFSYKRSIVEGDDPYEN